MFTYKKEVFQVPIKVWMKEEDYYSNNNYIYYDVFRILFIFISINIYIKFMGICRMDNIKLV